MLKSTSSLQHEISWKNMFVRIVFRLFLTVLPNNPTTKTWLSPTIMIPFK